MAKPLKAVGMVLGAAAMIATGVGAFAVAGSALAATAGTVATYASITAGVANLGAGMLAKPPPARGSITELVVEPDAAQPYVMGRGYYAGVLRHQAGYGGKVNDVHNPYLARVMVYSGGGPVQSISPRVDFATVGAYYTGFLATDTQLGACPEATALSLPSPYSGTPGWGAAHKLSGQAAIMWGHKFDKKGKVYASGLPLTGAYGDWVKVYDPRKDDTFPGGSGPHRLGNEATYEWSENPALHAGTYAYGRYQNGKRTFGIGLPADGIDWSVIASWANVCEANGWTMFGVIYEPGDRWANLKEICAAGGGEPIPGGVLSFDFYAPRVALDTITMADNAGDADSVPGMQSYRDRLNILIPKYTSADHNWELVQAEPVRIDTFIAEDGEEQNAEWPFNFVKDVSQASELAAYRLWNMRELQPIELHCKPRLIGYRPGDCLDVDRPDLGFVGPAVVVRRSIDPATMTVRLTMVGETPGKHAYCLGLTGTPPPTPALAQSAEDRDDTADDPFVSSLPDVIDEAGVLREGVVGTFALAPGSVTVPVTSATTDVYVAAGATVTALETGWITVGDATDGGAIVLGFGEIDSGTTKDVGGRIRIMLDSGAGYTEVATSAAGVRTASGDSYLKAAVLASETVSGVADIRVRLDITSIPMPSANAQAFTFRSPQIVIMGGKR